MALKKVFTYFCNNFDFLYNLNEFKKKGGGEGRENLYGMTSIWNRV